MLTIPVISRKCLKEVDFMYKCRKDISQIEVQQNGRNREASILVFFVKKAEKSLKLLQLI